VELGVDKDAKSKVRNLMMMMMMMMIRKCFMIVMAMIIECCSMWDWMT
jgi:hypothetical protein